MLITAFAAATRLSIDVANMVLSLHQYVACCPCAGEARDLACEGCCRRHLTRLAEKVLRLAAAAVETLCPQKSVHNIYIIATTMLPSVS